jgi:hypothetical protein
MIYGTPEFDNKLLEIIKHSKSEDSSKGKHSCYNECVEHAEEMSWHLYGNTPVELLERSRPREDEDIKQYRIENYEPTTKSAADKAINVVSKIFNPNLYSIRWKENSQGGEDLKKYALEYYPEFNSIVNYSKDVLLRKMLADPNGVAVVKPRRMPETDAEQLEPIMQLYGSKNVWHFDEDHYLIFIEEEEAKANQSTITWYYFEYYDRNQFISFRAYKTANDNLVIEEIALYPYNLQEIPVWRLQGIVESQDNGEVMYKSFFASAAPFWNLAIIHESDVLAAFIGHMHPIRWEISEECNHSEVIEGIRVKCREGRLRFGHSGTEGHDIECPSCGGTGNRNLGPYGVMKIPRDKLGEDIPGGVPLGYVAPPTEATKMLEERAARMEKKGLWAINMDVEDEVGEVQSGVAKAIDRSAQYDTLYNIATVVFDVHLTNFFYFSDQLMNGVVDSSIPGRDPSKNLPEINKPTQFDIAGTPELINNLKAAKESGLDPSVLNIKEQEILTRDFTTNPDLKLMAQKMLDLDPIQGQTPDEISLNVMKGFLSQVDAVIHFNKKRFIERAISENKAFLTLEKQEQIAVLEKYGQEFVTKNKPKLDTSMLDATKKKPIQAEA